MNDWSSVRNRTAIVGIGQTEFSRKSGKSELRLALEACKAAIDDAGIDRRDIDGIVRYGTSQQGASDAWLATNLGLRNVTYWGAIDYGGSASAALIGHAASAVAAGLANYVLCFRALNGRSGLRPGTADTYERLYRGVDPSYDNFLVPYGFTSPVQTYALLARRHMQQFGTTSEQLGQIAVTCRENANMNPAAQMYGQPMSLDEHQDSEMISDPLRKADCCLQTDGAAAVVVTSADRAESLAQKPVYISGAAQASLDNPQGPLHSLVGRRDITESPGTAAAKILYRQTGLGPDDIDVAQLYDCFTPTVLIQLEDYGFCGRGESGPFVQDHSIDFDGKIPINTDGGNLSAGYIHGLNHVLEGTRQMRGTSTRQVPGAQTCLVTAGTPVPTSALILTAGAL